MGRHGVTRYDIASVQRWSLSPRTSDVGYFFKIGCRSCWFFSSQMARWNSKQTQTVVHIRPRGERVFSWILILLFALCSLLPFPFPFPAIDTGIPCCINTFPHSLSCNPCSALIPRQPAHQAWYEELPWTAKIEEDSFRSESLERTLQTSHQLQTP